MVPGTHLEHCVKNTKTQKKATKNDQKRAKKAKKHRGDALKKYLKMVETD